jgi:hypothetical protein
MSQTCAISSCKRPSSALCHCCQQNICLPHLKEHQDLLVSELNPLIDQINALGDRLKVLNLENKMDDARQKLEQWRVECHKKIDHFFKEKCRELDRYVTKKVDTQREEISRIQSKAVELIREEHATRHDLYFLTSRIRVLERDMNKIEQTSFNIRSKFLEIDDSWITIEESSKHQFDLSNLPPIYKTIGQSDKCSMVVCSNDKFLLMHQKSNLCLVNRHLEEVKYVLWSDDYIYDMCWSSILDRFVVISQYNIFLVDQNTMSTEKISRIQRQEWYSCTCSDESLYLSTKNWASSVIEYSLLPSIQLIKHWKSPDTCQKNELINHMRYNNGTLAILVTKSSAKTVHIELRTSKTFQRLWLLELNIKMVQKIAFRCCLIKEDEWLVTDHESSRLIHITGDGKMKVMCAYNSTPLYSCIFGSDILAVVTRESINFH